MTTVKPCVDGGADHSWTAAVLAAAPGAFGSEQWRWTQHCDWCGLRRALPFRPASTPAPVSQPKE